MTSATLFWTREHLAFFCGMVSTLLFSAVWIPQILLNYQRKSTQGFSTAGMVVRLTGSAFLYVNACVTGEPMPVILYGGFGYLVVAVLIGQIILYSNNKEHSQLALVYLIPILPIALWWYFPATLQFSNLIKPISMIAGVVTQVLLCIETRTGTGCSVTAQHLNLFGALAGLYMCSVIPPVATTTWWLYIIALGQSFTFYSVQIYYDGLMWFLKESWLTSGLASRLSPEIVALLKKKDKVELPNSPHPLRGGECEMEMQGLLSHRLDVRSGDLDGDIVVDADARVVMEPAAQAV